MDMLSVKSVEDLVGTEVEWATKEVRGRYKSTIKSNCLLCGRAYIGGPAIIRQHLDKSITPRHVRLGASRIGA